MVDHIADSLKLLPSQFSNSPNIKAVLSAIMKQFNDLEESIQRINDGKWIADAVGTQLDLLGRIVGQPRDGMEDEEYDLWIKARVLNNRSSGTPGEITKLVQLLLGTDTKVEIEEHREPAVTLIVDKPQPKEFMTKVFNVIRSAMPLGVQLFLQHPILGSATEEYNIIPSRPINE